MNERRIKIKSSITQNEGKEALCDYYLTQKNKNMTMENFDKSQTTYFCKFCELNCKPYMKINDSKADQKSESHKNNRNKQYNESEYSFKQDD